MFDMLYVQSHEFIHCIRVIVLEEKGYCIKINIKIKIKIGTKGIKICFQFNNI
jgi:hypothetical protein